MKEKLLQKAHQGLRIPETGLKRQTGFFPVRQHDDAPVEIQSMRQHLDHLGQHIPQAGVMVDDLSDLTGHHPVVVIDFNLIQQLIAGFLHIRYHAV